MKVKDKDSLQKKKQRDINLSDSYTTMRKAHALLWSSYNKYLKVIKKHQGIIKLPDDLSGI